MEKTVKVDEETYRKINAVVGILRETGKRPVSMNEAISKIFSEVKTSKPSDFAGSWDMSYEASKKLKKNIRDLWKSWKRR